MPTRRSRRPGWTRGGHMCARIGPGGAEISQKWSLGSKWTRPVQGGFIWTQDFQKASGKPCKNPIDIKTFKTPCQTTLYLTYTRSIALIFVLAIKFIYVFFFFLRFFQLFFEQSRPVFVGFLVNGGSKLTLCYFLVYNYDSTIHYTHFHHNHMVWGGFSQTIQLHTFFKYCYKKSEKIASAVLLL